MVNMTLKFEATLTLILSSCLVLVLVFALKLIFNQSKEQERVCERLHDSSSHLVQSRQLQAKRHNSREKACGLISPN